METGAIKAAHIYTCANLFVTAALEINVKGVNFFFGGHEIFIPESEAAGQVIYHTWESSYTDVLKFAAYRRGVS